ncbi:MAG: PAS domain S-box protein [Bacteroidales bacterium]|nr:PAS domain S-box protein [Bacteroidales bacterium]MBN2750007.1 PAS domain S-box protein [Bacteroidales bacterium]
MSSLVRGERSYSSVGYRWFVEFLKDVSHISRSMIVLFSKDGRCLEVIPEVEKSSSLSLWLALVGLQYGEVLSGKSLESFTRGFSLALKQGRSERVVLLEMGVSGSFMKVGIGTEDDLFVAWVQEQEMLVDDENSLASYIKNFRRRTSWLSIPLLLIDPDNGRIVMANTAAISFYGYTQDELERLTVYDLNSLPEAYVKPRLQEAATNPRERYELSHRLKHGEIRDVVSHPAPIVVFEKTFVISAIVDVTEQNRALGELAASEVRFRELFRNLASGVAIFTVFDDNRVVFLDFNPAAERIAKVTSEEVVGRDLVEMFPGIYEYGLYDAILKVNETGNPVTIEPKYYRDSIREGWRQSFVYQLVSGEIVVVFDDVSAFKVSEQKLLDNQRLLDFLFQSMSQGVVFTDVHGGITKFNPAARRLLGGDKGIELNASPEDYIAQPLDAHGNPIPYERMPLSLAQVLRKPVMNYLVSAFLPKRNKRLWLTISCVVVEQLVGAMPDIIVVVEDVSQRIDDERKLVLNLDTFSQIFLKNTLPMLVVDSDTLRVKRANDAALEFYAVKTPEELDLFGISDLPEDELRRQFYIASQNQSGVIEVTQHRAQGDDRVVELHFKKVNLGHSPAVLCTTVDITERKRALDILQKARRELAHEVHMQTADLLRINNSLLDQIRRREIAEQELRDREQQLRLMYNNALAGFYRSLENEGGLVVYCNPYFANLLGYESVDQVLSVVNLVDHFSSARYAAYVDQVIKTGNAVYEFNFRNLRGEEVWVLNYSRYFKDKGYVEGVVVDITDRKRMEKLLFRREQRFRALVENSSDMIMHLKPDGTIIYMSPLVTKSLFDGKLMVREDNVLSLIPLEDRGRFRLFLDQMIETPNKVRQENFRMVLANGAIRTYEYTGQMLIGDPEYEGLVLNAHDVTDSIRINEEMSRALKKEQELNSHKNQFISTVSHEFRTPLTNISLNLQLLEKYVSEGKVEGMGVGIVRISKAVKRLTALVSEVSLISRDQSGRLEFHPVPMLYSELVRGVQEQIGYMLRSNIVLEISDSPNVEVLADTKLLFHIADNLLGNAIKYSPEKGSVLLKMGLTESKTLVLAVRDEGIGIPEADLKYIFEPYFRASNSKGFGGTGIGLSLVKRCVDLHGGSVSILSTLGEGTSVEVCIPL